MLQVWGSHCYVAEDRVFRDVAVSLGGCFATFWRITVPSSNPRTLLCFWVSSSVLLRHHDPSKCWVPTHSVTQHIPQDTNSCKHNYWEIITNTETSQQKSCWKMFLVRHTLTKILQFRSSQFLKDIKQRVVRYSLGLLFLKTVLLFLKEKIKLSISTCCTFHKIKRTVQLMTMIFRLCHNLRSSEPTTYKRTFNHNLTQLCTVILLFMTHSFLLQLHILFQNNNKCFILHPQIKELRVVQLQKGSHFKRQSIINL
jgi:hypothetical protein